MELNTILERLTSMPEKDRLEVIRIANEETADRMWVPNPGPQTEAALCLADEVFYGGQAGGGKTDLEIGLAVTEHEKSLLLRRTNKEASKLVERMAEIIGNRTGYNGQDSVWRIPGTKRVIDVGGCQLEEDKQKYKGGPHDLICFDEVSDFTESQYTFIIAWNRSATPGQRCRVVAAGNPPTRPEGLWVIKRWAAWLDPNHHNPAKPGELRWYTTGEEGKEIEVDGPGPHLIDGEEVFARSRTFIPAKLSDNPDLSATDYASVLSALPEELRAAYKEGRFDVGLKDGAYQVVPTSWIRESQANWTPKPPPGVPMCAMGVDIAQGGADETILAPRHDGWYAPMIAAPGAKTPDGKTAAGFVVANRRDGAKIIIDMGGGYGGACYEHLKDNGVDVVGYKGSEGSVRRTKDKQLKFANKRSEAYWKFREALDPSQPGGSPIMLPEDPALVADLSAPTFSVGPRGITVEPKVDVVKRLGRSPDRGDAVVMAWFDGAKLASHSGEWGTGSGTGEHGGTNRVKTAPKVVMGHQSARR